jgi:hypothetical protein
MRATGKGLLAMALCGVSACATTSAANDEPAVIARSDTQSAAELQSAVSKALNRTSVTLAGDALTRDSVLSIEPLRLRESRGNLGQGRAQGREARMPEQFRLVKNGQRCILIHERSGQRMELPNTQCAARR